MSWDRILSAAIVLFLVMDPLGNIPLFASVLERVEPRRRRPVLTRELLLALGFLVLFTFFGGPLLGVLHIRPESVSIAGGIIIFLIALRMIFPGAKHGPSDTDLEGEPLVVPLAVPLVAGPSAFATLLLLGEGADGMDKGSLIAALILAWGVSSAILALAMPLRQLIGRRGLIAIERLMGMILVALAVQMFLDGTKSYLGS
ncbi:MAG: MarC family protein [Myxococcota bacterium]